MERVAAALHEAFPPADTSEIHPTSTPIMRSALRCASTGSSNGVRFWKLLNSRKTLFLLQGPHDQNVGLFVERIQRFFSQELALPRKLYRVSFNIQGQTPRNGADWLAHMRDAFRSGTRPLGAELRQLVQKQALFVLLGQNPLPLDRLEPSTPRPYW